MPSYYIPDIGPRMSKSDPNFRGFQARDDALNFRTDRRLILLNAERPAPRDPDGGGCERCEMAVSVEFKDAMGPLKVIHVWHPETELEGVLVIDNVAAGPSIGGLRMAPDVTVEECFRLARAMTLKNACAGLAHGGGKSVIRADSRMPRERKEATILSLIHI